MGQRNPAPPISDGWNPRNNGMFTTGFNWCRISLAHPQYVRVCLHGTSWNPPYPRVDGDDWQEKWWYKPGDEKGFLPHFGTQLISCWSEHILYDNCNHSNNPKMATNQLLRFGSVIATTLLPAIKSKVFLCWTTLKDQQISLNHTLW